MTKTTDVFAPTKKDAINEKHLQHPKPGDYWHEMFCPACVIVATFGRQVCLCKTTKSVDDDHWTWDLGKLEMMTLDELREWLTYSGKGRLKNRCWCRVEPEAHKWAVERAKSMKPAEADDER